MFFQNFPILSYKFGNEVDLTVMQNISAFISIIDELKDDTAFYTTRYIEDYERPDTLSYKLYQDTQYYWTFFYLNEDIRESGWPLSELDLLAKAQESYPNWTVTTKDPIHDRFLPGQTVYGLQSKSEGVVIKRNIDLGQIIIKGPDNFKNGENILSSANDQVRVDTQSRQYLSVHHYELNGEWIDWNPFTQQPRDTSLSGDNVTAIRYIDRVRNKNNELREIKVFKQSVVAQIQGEYNQLLLRG